jgi:hypothetical protein
MAFEYLKNTVEESLFPTEATHRSPYWILITVPYDQRVTVSFSDVSNQKTQVAKADVAANPVKASRMLMLDNHCIKWSIQSNKSNHVHSASFTLVPPESLDQNGNLGVETKEQNTVFNKSYDIAPPDWVAFWAMEEKETYDRVRKLILEGKPANDAQSGLKFVGRVSSFRSQTSVSGNGVKTARYTMDCHGFREFDNTIYYNEMVFSSQLENPNKIINDIAKGINDFIVAIGDKGKMLVKTQTAIPALFHVLFDVDFTNNVIANTGLSDETKQIFGQLAVTPNKPYYVPEKLCNILGVRGGKSQVAPVYSDIVYQYIGIEQYRKSPTVSNSTIVRKLDFTGNEGYTEDTRNPRKQTVRSFADYWSDNLQKSARFKLMYEYPSVNTDGQNQQLDDDLIKQTLHFDERSVWSILSTYLNDPVNEMFTTLKVNPDGRIMPSLICRQLPFSSVEFSKAIEKEGARAITRFVELPRWKIGESLVVSFNVGLSDSLDVNYVRLEPLIPVESQTAQRAAANVFAPPTMDAAGISRNGLRIYHRQVSAADVPSATGATPTRFYQALMSDILMRQKYTVNGNLMCKGIQDPICIGDNLLLRDVLFHIEGIVHEGGIDPTGRKSFNTSIQLTHGIKLNEEKTDVAADYVPQDLKSTT